MNDSVKNLIIARLQEENPQGVRPAWNLYLSTGAGIVAKDINCSTWHTCRLGTNDRATAIAIMEESGMTYGTEDLDIRLQETCGLAQYIKA